jgi:ferredoxin
MQRRGWRLKEAELRGWLQGLLEGGRTVVAPVERDSLRLFRPLTSADEACLEPGKTRWSPKEQLFPRTEVLYSYTMTGRQVELHQPTVGARQRVLFGLRPCDAAGVVHLDRLFLGGQTDPFYAQRRHRTTIVTVACNEAEPECFCTAVGGSPGAADGADILVVPIDDEWLLSPVTEKGAELLATGDAGWSKAEDGDWTAADEVRTAVEAALDKEPLDPEISAALERAFDGAPWEEIGLRCLSCSVCAYVCPTCTCFDVHQQGDAWRGDQLRSWDACTYALFTRHASAHNPRPNQGSRYRQRLLHKFAYRQDGEEGTFRCVGCGRCIALCPAGIDIHATVHEMIRVSEEAGSDARG